MFSVRNLIISTIVINSIFISWTLDANSKTFEVAQNQSTENDWVKVEKDPITIEKKDGKKEVKFFTYRQRRGNWNIRLGLSVETWSIASQPTSSTTQSNIDSEAADFGFQVLGSYNLPIFSTGIGLNFSQWKLENSIKAFKFGGDLHVYLDGIVQTPYVVPYGKLGLGRISFMNPSSSDVEDFDTDLVMYYAGGFMFLLDWMQKSAAMDAYFDMGVKGSFLYVEYESFPKLTTAEGSVPSDFSAAGYKLGLQIVF